jgi:hypothetical protein
MKKISILLIFAMLLSACSMTVGQFLGIPATATVVPTFTITNTPTDVPTFTPTVPTPTFTVTTTLVGLKTKTSTPEFTPTHLIITPPPVTLLPSGTPIALIIPPTPIPGFASISVSKEEFYKGKACQPASVKFTVQVADAASVAFVVLFVRFKSKQSGATSEWTSITMQTTGVPGKFEHELTSLEMKAEDYFENAWVQYQIVSTDANSNQVGRTDVFSEKLTLLECVPSAIPVASITPTVQVP